VPDCKTDNRVDCRNTWSLMSCCWAVGVSFSDDTKTSGGGVQSPVCGTSGKMCSYGNVIF
jgi:hypothetical protein